MNISANPVYISLSEYAIIHNKTQNAVANLARRGSLKSAIKIGRNWVVDKAEPYPDNRVTTGKYRNWRQEPKGNTKAENATKAPTIK